MGAVNLTIPFYPGMPVGNVWAWDSPFRSEDIITHESHGGRLFHFSMHSESGTRFMMPALYDPTFPSIDRLDLARFVGMPAVVIDVPKAAEEEITAEDVDRRVAACPGWRDGDAVLLRTGWGDGERYRRIGDDYAIRTPHFARDGSERLVEVMRPRGSDLVLTDCAYVGNCAPYFMRREWAELPPWQRPPWPSVEARRYLAHYTRAKHEQDWSSAIELARNLFVVAALANCGSLTRERVRVTLLPIFIEGASGAPCTVLAFEDEEGR